MISKIKHQASEAFYFDDFELIDEKLYYINNSMPLTKERGKLRLVTAIARILGKERLNDLDFSILVEGKVTARQAIMLNTMEEELPFAFDVVKADDIELQEIMENTAKIMENLTAQLEDPLSEHP